MRRDHDSTLDPAPLQRLQPADIKSLSKTNLPEEIDMSRYAQISVMVGVSTFFLMLLVSYVAAGEPQGSFPETYVLFSFVTGACWVHAIHEWMRS